MGRSRMQFFRMMSQRNRSCKLPDGISLKEKIAEKQTGKEVTKKDSEGKQKNH